MPWSRGRYEGLALGVGAHHQSTLETRGRLRHSAIASGLRW
jgi:hypothetical protein